TTSRMALTDVMDVAIQITSALEAAHSAGIVHRDIKPDNIMLRPDGYVKVLDFGLAKLTEPHGPNSDEAATLIRTQPGVVVGTANYMSPEQARGVDVDLRTDIWSLGVVLYEMVAGHAPFTGATVTDVLVAILEKDPPHLREVPVRLVDTINKALQKDRKVRFQSAGEVLLELKQLRRELEQDLSTTPTQLITNTQPARYSKRLFKFLIPAIALIAVLVAYAAWQRLRKSNEPAAAERITLAVLPFSPLNAADEIGFLGVGIPDAVITRLANIQQIRVRPTSAILRYQNQNLNAQQVGQELASDYLVTGTLQKVGDSLRVNVQLVAVSNGESAWGEKFDKPRSDLLSLQDSIAQEIATALRIRMSDAEQERVYRRYTQNAAAYESYLRGRSQLANSTNKEVLAAVDSFEAALKLDPNYALARSGLAMACAQMHLYYAPGAEVQQWGDRAKQEAQQALKGDANLAETHQALAAVYGYTEFDWHGTISESQRALELNPSLDLPHYLVGRSFYHLGLLAEAEKEVGEGLEINPGAYTSAEHQFEALRTRGNIALLDGRFSDAVAALEQAHGFGAGPSSDWWLAQAYFYQGQKERAETLLEGLQDSPSASASARARAILASILAAGGEQGRAIKLIDGIESETYMDHHVAYSLGQAHAQLKQPEEALRWIRKAAETGFPCYPWFARDPLLEPLRSDPKFQHFMAELKNKYEAARAKYVS
ncbi:MAG TPA: protein kinase, partial [Pyrinomonadaceae bacterium]|nr:protein kinase [Pyrinomonadaceae bacterium]